MIFASITLIVQILGYIATALLFLSFQINDRRKVLAAQITGMMFLVVHQFFLCAYGGALANSIALVRNLVFRNKQKADWSKHFVWPYFFSLLLAGTAMFFWEGWFSTLPALAVVCSTVALWSDSEKVIRLLSLLGPVFWIPYGIIINSAPTVAMQIAIITSILIAMLRFDRRENAPS